MLGPAAALRTSGPMQKESKMQIVSRIPKTTRVSRTPEHPFNVSAKPYVIQPMMIAPVLPGETLSSLVWQARSQTEQLAQGLAGWWLETYYFYVKLSQLDSASEWIAPPGPDGGGGMLMNPEYDPTGLANTASVGTYHEDTSGINYVKRCQDIVVREWFRDEGEDETTAAGLLDTYPMSYVKNPGWMRSLRLTSALAALAPDLPDDAANATIRELERLEQQWQMLNSIGVTNMTYEDFLETFGIRRQNVNAKKPELIRHEKFWQLPATAVDGATGTTSSVVSWKVEGRADKDRLFKEHGFICGYIIARPKTYAAYQRTAGVTMLDSAFAWAPAMFDHNFAGVTIRDYADGRGPLYDGVSEGYTLDTKDLFLYGDQFLNHDLSAATGIPRHGPASGIVTSKFTTTGFVDGLFVAANTTNLVNHDGIVRLTIKSALRDTSPENAAGFVLPTLSR